MLSKLQFAKTMFAILFISLLAACVAEGEGGQNNYRQLPTDAEVEQHNATAKAGEEIVCRVETKVGTNIPKRVCRYLRDIQETSLFHRTQLGNVLR